MANILVVENDRHLREVITLILTIKCFKVLAVSNVKKAKSEIKEDRFDLILLDIDVKDSDTFSEQIKKYYPDIKVVITGGIKWFSPAIKKRNLFFDFFLLKPFDDTELTFTIKEILNINGDFEKLWIRQKLYGKKLFTGVPE